MSRLERMTREAVHWMPQWGPAWARDYLTAALLAEQHDADARSEPHLIPTT